MTFKLASRYYKITANLCVSAPVFPGMVSEMHSITEEYRVACVCVSYMLDTYKHLCGIMNFHGR